MDVIELLPLNDSYTYSAPDNYFTNIIYLQIYMGFAVGIPLNLLVMYISFINNEIKENYKYFLGNLALCDILLLCSLVLSNFVHLYVVLFRNGEFTPLSCTIFRTGMYTFG